MKKIMLDPGHGGHDPGAVGNGLQEKNVVLKIARFTKEIFDREYTGVEVRLTRSTDVFLTLAERVRLSNNYKPDIFCSIHNNGHNDSSANGFETFIANNASASSVRYQGIIHPDINKRAGLRDRGQKRANFTVISQTHAPAILTEIGFIGNASDGAKLKSDSYLREVARGHVEGIVRALGGITRKTPSKTEQPTATGNLFRIQVGAFGSRTNAENFLRDVQRHYPGAFITQ